MKTISLISRLENLSMSEFRDYYEQVHCLKAMKYFPFKRYRRNYIVAGGDHVDFNCVSEVKIEPSHDLSAIVDSGAWTMMKEDERQFMRPEKIRFSRVDEWAVVGIDEALSAPGEPRFLMLFERGSMHEAEFCEYLREIGRGVTKKLGSRIKYSFDVVKTAKERALPFEGLMWITADLSLKELCECIGDLPGLRSIVQVESYESDPEVMQYRFKGID